MAGTSILPVSADEMDYSDGIEVKEVLVEEEALNQGVIKDPQDNSAIYLKDNGIPRINIELSGVTIEEINNGEKETKYLNNIMAVAADEDNTAVYDTVEIKGRGNSTWNFEKKPYQIKFDKKISLFGMDPSKKYVLLANAIDQSLLRNAIGFDLGTKLGLYHSDYQYVDLYVDGGYLGNYILTQKTEIGSYSAALTDESGVLVEVDMREVDDPDLFSPFSNCHLVLKDVVSSDEEISMAAFNSFVNAFGLAEEAAYENDWETVQSLIDVDSFAAYYLFSEFICNPDANRASFFMHRDGEDDLIHAGPVWDFDRILGNSGHYWDHPEELYLACDERIFTDYYPETGYQTKLFNDLMTMPEFRTLVADLWNNLGHDSCTGVIAKAKSQAADIRLSAEDDAKQWEYTWEKDEKVIGFMEKRIAYFDKIFSQEDEDPCLKLTGADRYATAALAAKEAFPDGAETIVLACGNNFPDALSAGALAAELDAPILLTGVDSLSTAVRDLLLGRWYGIVKNVVIIGGVLQDQVVSDLVACDINRHAISKYYGQDRYQTAEAVFRQVMARNNEIDTVAIAIGTKPADALSMSPWSYATHIPILLADANGELTPASRALVARQQIKQVILLGGGVKESCAGKKAFVRLAGSDRYETSLNIAAYFAENDEAYQ
ncbi:MAG: CotH kinase family protein, partial [Lachnospiraceae bacterium]|nr:CotH kinase family protein [Candidatus Equihabitans merdae]